MKSTRHSFVFIFIAALLAVLPSRVGRGAQGSCSRETDGQRRDAFVGGANSDV
jgi:hypothetical protein